MYKKNELSLLGALAICAMALVIRHFLKLPAHNDPKQTGIKEDVPII